MTAPVVIAPAGAAVCGQPPPERDRRGVYCERPAGHAGGHLCASHKEYWQAREVKA